MISVLREDQKRFHGNPNFDPDFCLVRVSSQAPDLTFPDFQVQVTSAKPEDDAQ